MTRAHTLTLAPLLVLVGAQHVGADRAASFPVIATATPSIAERDTPLSRRAAIDGPLGRFSGAEAMTSRDPRARAAAAERLGRFGPTDHALAILHDALTRETELEVRFALVRALGRRGDPRSVSILVDELQSGSDVEVLLAVDALRSIGGVEGARGLVGALTVTIARPRAIEACAELGDAALAPLVAAIRLDAGNAAALEALSGVLAAGVTPTDEALTALVASSAHPMSEVRLPATRALGESRASRVAAAVRARLRDDVQDVVRAAFDALGRVGDTSDVPALRDHVVSASPYFAEATRALLRVDPSAGDAAIAEVLARGDDYRRAELAEIATSVPASPTTLLRFVDERPAAIIDALASRADPAAREALVSLARGRRGEIGQLARVGLAIAYRRHGLDDEGAGALGDDFLRAVAGDDGVVDTLERALGSADADARAQAALALEWLGEGADALAARVAEETDPAARRAACDALVSMGRASSDPHFDASLTSPELLADCGLYVAPALGAMSERRRRAYRVAFRRALRSPDERLATVAARALAASRDVEAVPALVAMIEHGGAARRLAAVSALHTLGRLDAAPDVARIMPTAEARAALARVTRAPARDVLWTRVTSSHVRGPLDVDLVGSDGVVRRVRARADGFVLVPFPAGGMADVRVANPAHGR